VCIFACMYACMYVCIYLDGISDMMAAAERGAVPVCWQQVYVVIQVVNTTVFMQCDCVCLPRYVSMIGAILFQYSTCT
jgi:hypothetical protein